MFITIPEPTDMTWDTWNALMCGNFAEQQLELFPEDRWEDLADSMAVNGFFAAYGFPTSRGFDSWQSWARTLVGIWS
jgi:hypothetical protein